MLVKVCFCPSVFRPVPGRAWQCPQQTKKPPVGGRGEKLIWCCPWQGRDTTYEERIALVHECIENGYNYTGSAQKHKVGYQQIYTWVQKYKKDGEEGLKDRRGRHKKDYKPQTEEERLKLEVTTLKRQLYLSQMEIDVLKKLQELERGNR